jgi:hypothetical protein
MNRLNENQHYVSRVLLERFKCPGIPLQCFELETGEWKPRSVEKACAASGYNQLLSVGQVDNTLEEAFSKIESRLPKTLRALEKIAAGGSTELAPSFYDNMCWYCAFLKLSSLPAKAAAVVNFVMQLNLEVKIGQRCLLRELQIPEDVISQWKKESAAGQKIIINSENVLQLVYRSQFLRSYTNEFAVFRDAQWAVSTSPIELPMSDIGLIPIHLSDENANHYILPISPTVVLEGIFFLDLTKNAPRRPLKKLCLTGEQAEYPFDAICSSAVIEIICSRKIPGISASLARAKRRGIRFHTIVAPKALRAVGLQATAHELRFRTVPVPEYVNFIHSFVKPPPDR